MKKKAVAAIVSLAMMGIMVLPVSADDMSVLYRQPNTYTVTIPASVDLSSGADTRSVEVSKVNLEPGAEIKIKISSGISPTEAGVVELERENDTETKARTIVSKTEGGAGIASGADFVTFTEDGAQTLYFSAVTALDGSTDIKAGNYTGTITFTVTAPEKN